MRLFESEAPRTAPTGSWPGKWCRCHAVLVKRPRCIDGLNMRIVLLGAGFGGATTVRQLEQVLRRRTDVEITLVSRENFFVLTPLLFEACSGSLELRHCAQPIRAALRRARFIEATVESVDLERQLVRAVAPDGGAYSLLYDHL